MGEYKQIIFSNKRQLVYRIIVEQYLGRELRPEEVVHHIDGNPSNNDILNLIVFEDNGCHLKYQLSNRKRYYRYKTVFGKHLSRPGRQRDYGIVLYGPAYKKKKAARFKALAEKTKRDLRIIAI